MFGMNRTNFLGDFGKSKRLLEDEPLSHFSSLECDISVFLSQRVSMLKSVDTLSFLIIALLEPEQ